MARSRALMMLSPADIVVTGNGLRFSGRRFPCSVGTGYVSDNKREGDGATPQGVHRIIGCMYRPDRLSAPNIWSIAIRPGHCWSDDAKDPAYNSLHSKPSPYSHESMCRADPLYDLVLLTDWNWPDPVPGRGSAIFMHQWRKPRHPTQGCVALSRQHLHWIAKRLIPGTKLVVA